MHYSLLYLLLVKFAFCVETVCVGSCQPVEYCWHMHFTCLHTHTPHTRCGLLQQSPESGRPYCIPATLGYGRPGAVPVCDQGLLSWSTGSDINVRHKSRRIIHCSQILDQLHSSENHVPTSQNDAFNMTFLRRMWTRCQQV